MSSPDGKRCPLLQQHTNATTRTNNNRPVHRQYMLLQQAYSARGELSRSGRPPTHSFLHSTPLLHPRRRTASNSDRAQIRLLPLPIHYAFQHSLSKRISAKRSPTIFHGTTRFKAGEVRLTIAGRLGLTFVSTASKVSPHEENQPSLNYQP